MRIFYPARFAKKLVILIAVHPGPGDLLVAVLGSGETPSVVESAQRARRFGARLAVVTVAPGSTLAGLADHLTVIPGETTKLTREINSRLPLASALEQAMVLCFDCLAAWLAERTGQDNDAMMARHANLE